MQGVLRRATGSDMRSVQPFDPGVQPVGGGVHGAGIRPSEIGHENVEEIAQVSKSQGDMTVKEAGRMGGNAVKNKYGSDFFSEIGKKGGRTVSDERGAEFFSAIGRVGGKAVKERFGPDHYLEIGKKGGDAVKEKYGPDYYKEIGKKGGAARRRNTRATSSEQ